MRILQAHHSTAVEPVAHAEVKVIIVIAGWTRLEHRKRVAHLAEGDVAILPARALVSGVPLPAAETVTFYFDPLFLEQQTAWTSAVTPVAAALRAAAAGTGSILSLRPSLLKRGTPERALFRHVMHHRKFSDWDSLRHPSAFWPV